MVTKVSPKSQTKSGKINGPEGDRKTILSRLAHPPLNHKLLHKNGGMKIRRKNLTSLGGESTRPPLPTPIDAQHLRWQKRTAVRTFPHGFLDCLPRIAALCWVTATFMLFAAAKSAPERA
jgi:hypothetical protein